MAKYYVYNILLLLSTLLLIVLLTEISLQASNYEYTPLAIKIGKKNDLRNLHAFEDSAFIYDPKLLWRPKTEDSSIFNYQGFRGKIINAGNNNYFKIFALGDSNTLGQRTNVDTSWPHYLEEKLNQGQDEALVINAGVWGYSSLQGLERLKEIVVYKPDMVLISFGANDAHMVLQEDREWNTVYSVASWQSTHIKLYSLIQAGYDNIQLMSKKLDKEPLVHRVPLSEFKNNLSKMIRISKDHKFTPVFLTRPFVGQSPHQFWWKNFAPDYNKATVEVATEENVPVIDAYSYFKAKEELFYDESHFTQEGQRIMGEFIYQYIMDYI